MSDYERNKGKLIPSNKTIDDLFTELGGVEYNLDVHTKEEYVRDVCYEYDYEIINDTIYKVEFDVKGDCDYPEFADVKMNKDGSIDFHTYHYNGGAHWTEVVSGELAKQSK